MEKDLSGPIFNKTQEHYVKEYFLELDKKLGVYKDTPEKLQNEFSKKLANLAKKNTGFINSGKTLVASVLGAFSLGIIFSQLALMPATIATRGYSVESSEAVINPPQVISLKVDSPKDYSFRLANASLEADVEVSLVGSGNKVEVILHSLMANAEDQAELKRMLSLGADASGDYTVIVSPRR